MGNEGMRKRERPREAETSRGRPTFPHSLIPSFPHSLIPSFPHSLIPSFPHSLIPSFPHFPPSLIPSFPPQLSYPQIRLLHLLVFQQLRGAAARFDAPGLQQIAALRDPQHLADVLL